MEILYIYIYEKFYMDIPFIPDKEAEGKTKVQHTILTARWQLQKHRSYIQPDLEHILDKSQI